MNRKRRSFIFFQKKVCNTRNLIYICIRIQAEVAQLVELQPSKLVVASSSLVFRSKKSQSSGWDFLFLGVPAPLHYAVALSPARGAWLNR